MVPGSNPGGGEIFRIRLVKPQSPPILICNEHRVSVLGLERPGQIAVLTHSSSAGPSIGNSLPCRSAFWHFTGHLLPLYCITVHYKLYCITVHYKLYCITVHYKFYCITVHYKLYCITIHYKLYCISVHHKLYCITVHYKLYCITVHYKLYCITVHYKLLHRNSFDWYHICCFVVLDVTKGCLILRLIVTLECLTLSLI
jgi:hypothetical protein